MAEEKICLRLTYGCFILTGLKSPRRECAEGFETERERKKKNIINLKTLNISRNRFTLIPEIFNMAKNFKLLKSGGADLTTGDIKFAEASAHRVANAPEHSRPLPSLSCYAYIYAERLRTLLLATNSEPDKGIWPKSEFSYVLRRERGVGMTA